MGRLSMLWTCHWGSMRLMEINRRALLCAASGGAALAGIPGLARAACLSDSSIALCGRQADGHDYAFVGKRDASDLKAIVLPGRGHGPTFSPTGNRVAFPARRPGTFCLIIDQTQEANQTWLHSPTGRHFCGHSVFIDETTLVTTENDFIAGRGILGIWNVTTGTRLAEYSSHGIGPHDVLALQGGRAILVANGGILTHPETGRIKLNIPTMKPNLSIIDVKNGRLLEKVQPPPDLHKVSLRHLANAGNDMIIVGGQFEGPESENPPLVATWRPGNPLTFPAMEHHDRRAMAHYCGSVAIDPSGQHAVATSPRGGVAHILSLLQSPSVVNTVFQPDVCGAAASGGNSFILTSGQGEVLSFRITPDGIVRRRALNKPLATQWDNHAGVFL